MTRTVIAAVLAAAAGAAGAQPLTSMQMQSFSGVPNFTSDVTAGVDSFMFDFFNASDFGNPAFVNLLSAEIEATATIQNGLLEVDNDGLAAAVIPLAELGASVNLSSDALALALPSVAPVTTTSFNLAANNGDDDSTFQSEPGDPDFGSLSGGMVSDTDSSLFNQPLASLFEGPGQFDIDFTALSIFNAGGVGGVSFAGTPVDIELKVKVIYTYEIVPAPGAAAVLGLGGLVAARRRR